MLISQRFDCSGKGSDKTKVFGQSAGLHSFQKGGNMKTMLLALAFCGLSGCVTTGMMSKTGIALVNVQTESGGLAYNKGEASKSGKACSNNILGLAVFGDSSIEAARQDGELNKVFYFDTDFFNVLGLYGHVCTKAYGQ